MTNFSEKKVLCTLLLLLRESEYFLIFFCIIPFTSSLKDSYIEMVDKKYELAQYTIATLIAVYFPCIVFSNSPLVPSSLHRALLNIICKGIILVAAIAILVNRLHSYSIEQFFAFEVDTGNLNVYNYNCLKKLIL